MKVALFFGSYNPIHIGHLIIANAIAESKLADKVWLVVSPQSPFKEKKDLLSSAQRLYLANIAVEDNYNLQVSDIEMHLPQPSYTIDTLTHLKEKYPKYEFSIVMGQDNLEGFHRWKNYEKIQENHKIIVYQRGDTAPDMTLYHSNITLLDLPLLDISASHIRQCVKAKKSIKYLVVEKVREEIEKGGFYK
jgi:nicotinate-nucleotide adenylyltransferase